MDEVWLRLVLVGGGLSVAGAMAFLARRREGRPFRRMEVSRLGSGVYLFSSLSCDSCAAARARLDERLGIGGYTEFVWEQDPQVFAELAVDAVPATLIVAGNVGRLYRGRPDRALRRL